MHPLFNTQRPPTTDSNNNGENYDLGYAIKGETTLKRAAGDNIHYNGNGL
jgi:hypothetical protein